MNIYMICTLWTPFQAERNWQHSYPRDFLNSTLIYILFSLVGAHNRHVLWQCFLEKSSKFSKWKKFLSFRDFIFQTIFSVLQCSGRRLYQYNEDDLRCQFWFISSCKTAWIHINIEVKRSCQWKKLLFDYL